MPRNASGVYSQPASNVNPPISGTVIDPVAFAAALTDIATELTNSIDRLGRGGMTAALAMGGFKITGLGAAVAATDAARLSDVQSYVPPGAIMDFAMVAAPAGWLICDGSAVSRTTYAALFTAIGTTWGVGDGSTTFNLPDIRGAFRRTLDAGKGRDPARVFATFQTDTFASHTHVQNSHTHSDSGHTHTYSVGTGTSSYQGGANFAFNASVGSGTGTGNANITATTATNQVTGGTETTVKNIAVQTCIRT